jgi:hypothetical protein
MVFAGLFTKLWSAVHVTYHDLRGSGGGAEAA